MKIKKYNKFLKFILPNNVRGITLAPFGIYFRNDISDNVELYRILNHEKIHWKQQIELLIIFFYIWYIIEFLILKIKYKKEAYINISFEKEAYLNQKDMSYCRGRRRFEFLKYFKHFEKFYI